jgi:hypothetical protein
VAPMDFSLKGNAGPAPVIDHDIPVGPDVRSLAIVVDLGFRSYRIGLKSHWRLYRDQRASSPLSFVVLDFMDLRDDALNDLQSWVAARKRKVQEDVIDGLENTPKALIGLLAGENRGKRMIEVQTSEAPWIDQFNSTWDDVARAVSSAVKESSESRPISGSLSLQACGRPCL